LSLYFKLLATKMREGVDVLLHALLTFTPSGCEGQLQVPALPSQCSSARLSMSLRVTLGSLEKRNICYPCRDSNIGSSSPVASSL